MKCRYCGDVYSENVIELHESRCPEKVENKKVKELTKPKPVDLSQYAKDGGWYEFPNGEKIRGKEKALEYYKENIEGE